MGVSHVSFCREDYEDMNELFADMGKLIQVLFKNGYTMKLWFDGLTYVVEYDLADRNLCDQTLEWLSPEELEMVWYHRYDKEDEDEAD